MQGVDSVTDAEHRKLLDRARAVVIAHLGDKWDFTSGPAKATLVTAVYAQLCEEARK